MTPPRLICAALAALLIWAAPAAAAPVTVLGADGRARTVRDPAVEAFHLLPARRATHRSERRRTAGPAPRAGIAARKRTVVRELRRLLSAGAIDQAEYDERRRAYTSAKSLVRRLSGRRRIEMASVVSLLDSLAARRQITASRLEPLWLTLERNRRWWTTGPLLASGQRISFEGSEMLWQYFPGQGVQIHPLGNFGKLNALWRSKRQDGRLAVLMDEMLAVAADRAGGVAWEYYFNFGGGRPPWVSGLAQGTAVQSLARAATRLERQAEVFPVLKAALRIFETPPPVGVRQPVGDGAHYLIYSFDSRLRVLNGFVQALVGLHDLSTLAADADAARLFADGERVARVEVPTFDTGAWSLYSRLAVKRESDLSYHKLLRDFLVSLCDRMPEDPVYCGTARNFTGYLKEEPELDLLTTRVRGGATRTLKFRLSKISRVGVSIFRGDRVVFQRAAALNGYGTRTFTWTTPRSPGTYDVRLTAVDLAGNVGRIFEPVEVTKPRKRKRT